ncbi:Shedu anti-phage system protein SduA domain-containing protein [Brevibacillus dissolubilis]|uniref:Shedu anti-phage system protein SduA domain-containing protein n=1 Tax=Brevibacillus dissolubilis TaxID=1844116 RepID=UPI0021002B65|nr:Shedu anti-phage system protein SduA domain-containing protein [Brevibacillus dissolubilis]
MGIYDRDYTRLTQEESKLWQAIQEKEKVGQLGELWIRKSLFLDYPKAARHYMSLFPNHYLDIVDLKNEQELHTLNAKFLKEIDDPQVGERRILNWIRDNKAYFIIASLMKSNYNFGHHAAYIMPEFKLGNSYQVDFLLIGKSSGGYEFIFVELESPYGKITTSDGGLGDSFRKGMKQVENWEEWLEAYYTSFEETLIKYKHPKKSFPHEFLKLDKTRLHYTVVAGRRTDFNDKTYRIKRKAMENQKILLLHYDNLYQSAEALIGASTY